jgi:O-antigen/teichoic acid export membrane protein
MESHELKRRTFHSTAWNVVRIATSNLLGFAVFSVLARILSPREFGIFALASVVIEFARILTSAGLADAVMRTRELDEAFADTAFWANLLLGCFVGIVTWVGAPLYASMTLQPEVTPILRWLALLIPISSLSGIHVARKLREFGYKPLALRIVIGSLLSGLAAVAAAFFGFGVWSLVIQAAINDGVLCILVWQTYRWRPRLRFHGGLLANVFAFSASVVLTQVMFTILTRIQDMIIARFVSAPAVGVYRVAWRLNSLIVQTTIQPLADISLVTFAQLQDDRERFRGAYLRMLGLSAFFTLPALFGLGFLSDEVIALLFGPKWDGAGDVVKILAPMAVPIVLNSFGGHALAALGRSATIARVATVQAALTLVFSLVAAPYGLRWIAAAYVLRGYLTLPYFLVQLQRETGIAGLSMLRAIMAPFVASLLMVGILAVLGSPLRTELGSGLAYVGTSMVVGCDCFMGALWSIGGNYIRANIIALRPLWRDFVSKSTVSERLE